MAKSPVGSSFKRYAKKAPTAEMRELAHVAGLQNLSQEQLAKLYAARADVEASGANVMRNFMTKRPTIETVEAYAFALKVTREHLDLAVGRMLSPGRANAVLGEIESDLRNSVTAEVADAALRALKSLPPDLHQRALAAYALENYRSRFGSAIVRLGLKPGLAALEKHLPEVDLTNARIVHDPNESFLVTLLVAARGVLDDSHADTLLAVGRSLARDQGLDTSQMESRLAKAQKSTSGHFYKAARRLSPSGDKT